METSDLLDIEQIKADACNALREDAEGYLDDATIERRLAVLKEAPILNAADMVAEIRQKTGFRICEDKVGGVILFDEKDKLARVALLERTDDEMVAFHTAVHEGIHLLGPDSRPAHDGWDPLDRYTIHQSLGPRWTSFTFDDDGSVVEVREIFEDEKIFWEAVTDYVAMQKTAAKFGQEAVDNQIASGVGAGFIQRYWVAFLIENHPNPEELSGAMKAALYQGNMREFLRILGGMRDNRQVSFYNTLTYYMGQGEQALNMNDTAAYHAALDKFMEEIRIHFASGGAYSLDMSNY